MKYEHVYTLFLMFVFCTSCEQNQTNTPKDKTKPEPKDIATPLVSNEKDIYTKYEYTDAIGRRLIIQNGYPRGGMKYTDPNGGVYVYATFWTRIINETDNRLELKFDFPVNSYEVPSLPGKYYKILVPPDTMTLEKFPLFNYGLTDLKKILDTSIHKSSSLKRTINPKESSGFYIVIVFDHEVGAPFRTGLSIKGKNLVCRISRASEARPPLISEKEIDCGSINFKNLMLKK